MTVNADNICLGDLTTVLTTKDRECSLNQSNVDSFVGRVTKDNSENNCDRHKIHKVFPTNCIVFVVTSVRKIVYSSASAQITAYLLEKTLQSTVPW